MITGGSCNNPRLDKMDEPTNLCTTLIAWGIPQTAESFHIQGRWLMKAGHVIVGLDVHKNSIVAAVLPPEQEPVRVILRCEGKEMPADRLPE